MSRAHEASDSAPRAFFAPLCRGGTAVARAALDRTDVTRVAAALAASEEAFEAFADGVGALGPVSLLRWPPAEGSVALGMAARNLAAATDPRLDAWWRARERRRMLAATDALAALAGRPEGRSDLLFRHVVLSGGLDVRRRDATVRNWAYTYRYFGRPVPARVVAAPRLRRVSREDVETPLVELWTEPPFRDRFDALAAGSPLTPWLRWDVEALERVGRPIWVLDDPWVRAAVVRATVAHLPRAVPALARALEESVAAGRDARGRAALWSLVCDTHVELALLGVSLATLAAPAAPFVATLAAWLESEADPGLRALDRRTRQSLVERARVTHVPVAAHASARRLAALTKLEENPAA